MDDSIREVESRILRYLMAHYSVPRQLVDDRQRALLAAGVGTYSLRDDVMLLERLYVARETQER